MTKSNLNTSHVRQDGESYADYNARMKEVRREQARKRQREKRNEKILTVLLGVVAAIAVIALVLGLGGLVFLAAWNLGVVPIAAAAGATVGKIGFWTAVGGSLVVGILTNILSGGRLIQVKKD